MDTEKQIIFEQLEKERQAEYDLRISKYVEKIERINRRYKKEVKA